MKVDPFLQQRLLDVQAIDQTLAQLAHELEHSPMKAAVAEARRSVIAADESAVAAQTSARDLEREVARADQDVQNVRNRVTRDEQLMQSGSVGAKQLTDVEHELVSLARRQAELEDVELELMEKLEQAQASTAQKQVELEQAQAALEDAENLWVRRAAEIENELTSLRSERGVAATGLPEELLALYEKIRARSGIGAAALTRGRCGSCNLELTSSDLERIRSAAADDVLRCEECGAITVRTFESGL